MKNNKIHTNLFDRIFLWFTIFVFIISLWHVFFVLTHNDEQQKILNQDVDKFLIEVFNIN